MGRCSSPRGCPVGRRLWPGTASRPAEGDSPAKVEKPVFRRAEVFRFFVLPEELIDSWCGTPPEFSLLDRLPVAAIAGGIFVWAGALGWLLLVWLGATEG